MSKDIYPKVTVFVTKSNKFRAKVQESQMSPKYEVTIGGNEWHNGKGILVKEIVVKKCIKILGVLCNQFDNF